MKKATLLIPLIIFAFGCALLPISPESPVPILEEDCRTPITDEEVASLLDYQHDLFTNADWARSYTVTEDKAYVSYNSSSFNAVVRIDVFRLCASEFTLEGYVTPQILEVITAAYEDVVLEDSCKQDRSLLFQHSATSQGFAYKSKLWFTPMEDPNRVLKVMIVFPSGDESNMTSFSQAFFPNFTSCSVVE